MAVLLAYILNNKTSDIRNKSREISDEKQEKL